eukprot:1378061-Prymnesium_polylepis.1
MAGDFDPGDCLDDVEEDWQEDSGGKHYLGGGDFFKCWRVPRFIERTPNGNAHLIGLTVSCTGEYATFIYKLSDAICLPGGGYRDEQVAAL